MKNGTNNTLVIGTVLTLAGILGIMGMALAQNSAAGLIGFIALLFGLAILCGEIAGLARRKRADHSS